MSNNKGYTGGQKIKRNTPGQSSSKRVHGVKTRPMKGPRPRGR